MFVYSSNDRSVVSEPSPNANSIDSDDCSLLRNRVSNCVDRDDDGDGASSSAAVLCVWE